MIGEEPHTTHAWRQQSSNSAWSAHQCALPKRINTYFSTARVLTSLSRRFCGRKWWVTRTNSGQTHQWKGSWCRSRRRHDILR
eukprot:40232-Eustigmatos_ZCMA.PRE.1